MTLRLEEVFKISGVPTHTFVKPMEYARLLVALRTPGRGVVIEGPSGIGKTTSVRRALEELDLAKTATALSARKAKDVETIRALPDQSGAGVVIVDDFHRLSEPDRRALADFMKVLADEEREDTKLVVVGITRAGDTLIQFGEDLQARLDTIPFESNPDERVAQVLELGEKALNIAISTKDDIVRAASGSFYLAQYLAHQTCVQADLLEEAEPAEDINVSFEVVRQRVMESLGSRFMDVARSFARGTKLRRSGRAPYLHILKWLAEANEWSINLDREISMHPELRGSVGQVVEKRYLENLIDTNEGLRKVFHYSPESRILAVEDPQFVFFIRNLLWNKFAEDVGFVNILFDSRYDFALSFAGADRDTAEALFLALTEREFEVFYDKNEAHRILAEDIEDYLGPIYESEARFVICLLGPEYPKRIWTKFESDKFKARFGENSVIPIHFTTAPAGMFDESTKVGGYRFDPAGDVTAQLAEVTDMLARKMEDVGAQGSVEEE